MKCTKCSVDKPISEFCWKNKTKNKKHTACKACTRKASKVHYERNKPLYINKAAIQRKKLEAFVANLKCTTPCMDCNVSYPDEPWLMEFDHLVDKMECVSKLVKYNSLKKVLKEIDKCEIVCLICHRRRTAKRGKYGLVTHPPSKRSLNE